MSGLRVMAEPCKTCVFGENSAVSKARLGMLAREWKARDTHQVCHQTAVWDEDEPAPPLDEQAVCRGFFDKVFMPRGTGQLLRIAERLGGFDFVRAEDES